MSLTVDDGNGHSARRATASPSPTGHPPRPSRSSPPSRWAATRSCSTASTRAIPTGIRSATPGTSTPTGPSTPTGVTANWVNVPAGAHGVTLTVSDGTIFDSVNKTINVALPPNVPPIADFIIAPNPANVGQAVTFDGASSKDPDLGGIVRYDWTFGDGSKATTTTPSAKHAYASAGSYTATLKVTDNRAGTATLASAVKISPTPLPPNRPPAAAFSFTPERPGGRRRRELHVHLLGLRRPGQAHRLGLRRRRFLRRHRADGDPRLRGARQLRRHAARPGRPGRHLHRHAAGDRDRRPADQPALGLRHRFHEPCARSLRSRSSASGAA